MIVSLIHHLCVNNNISCLPTVIADPKVGGREGGDYSRGMLILCLGDRRSLFQVAGRVGGGGLR